MKELIFNYLMRKQWFTSLIKERFDNEMEFVQFNQHAEGCGLEDRNITDKYDAMQHGWEVGVEAVEEAFNNATNL